MRAPSPAQEPVPAPAKDDNRDGQCTLAIAKTMTGSGGDGHGTLFGRPFSDANRSLAESSLQAKHVRIDA